VPKNVVAYTVIKKGVFMSYEVNDGHKLYPQFQGMGIVQRLLIPLFPFLAVYLFYTLVCYVLGGLF